MGPIDTDETFDSIPWERLLSDPRDRRRRWLTYGAVGLVVLAVSASLSRTLWPVPSRSETPSVTVAVPPTHPPSSPQSSEPTLPALLSEADLLAVEDDPVSVAGSVEWFLTEYFTVEPGVENPAREGVMPVESVRSFVDSAHVVGVYRTGLGRYRVEAMVRVLYDDGSGFRRLPAMAVEVPVELTEDGYRVGSAPRPIDRPAVWSPVEDGTTVPDDVAAEARERAGRWGTPVETASLGRRIDGFWEVTVLIELADGLVWPFTIEVPDG